MANTTWPERETDVLYRPEFALSMDATASKPNASGLVLKQFAIKRLTVNIGEFWNSAQEWILQWPEWNHECMMLVSRSAKHGLLCSLNKTRIAIATYLFLPLFLFLKMPIHPCVSVYERRKHITFSSFVHGVYVTRCVWRVTDASHCSYYDFSPFIDQLIMFCLENV